MEEEEKGISIGEIFKVIFKRVWWVVGVTAAVLLLFVCIIQFWYNPSTQTYTASFDIRLPSGDTYPDGTELRLEDSILLENLQIIKNESLLSVSERTGKFSNVDIDKMVEEDDIKFQQAIMQMEDETYEYHNTVSIVKKYFKNKEQAAEFVKAVAEFPVNTAKNIVDIMNYSENLSRFDRYKTYEEKISALVDHKEYILSMYNKISDKYSGDYVPAGLNANKTIDDYIRELTNVFDAVEQEAVSNTVSANYYVYDVETYVANAEANIAKREIDIENNNRVIQTLQTARKNLLEAGGNIVATEAYEVRIADLSVENSNLANEVEEIRITLERINAYKDGDGKAAKEAFDARLSAIRAQLDEATQTLKTVTVATYAEKAQAIYVYNKISVKGGLNIILAAVIGAVLGFVVVSVVILIIDLPKRKRELLAAQAATAEGQELPQDGEEKAE